MTESVEFWRVALARSLLRMVSGMPGMRRDSMGSLDRTVLEGTGVSGITSLDLETNTPVLAQVGRGRGGSVLRHGEDCCVWCERVSEFELRVRGLYGRGDEGRLKEDGLGQKEDL